MGDSFALARFPVGCADVWRGAPSAAPTRATLLAPFLLASPICAPLLLASSLSPAPPLAPLAWSSRAPRRAARLRLAGCLGAAGSPAPLPPPFWVLPLPHLGRFGRSDPHWRVRPVMVGGGRLSGFRAFRPLPGRRYSTPLHYSVLLR